MGVRSRIILGKTRLQQSHRQNSSTRTLFAPKNQNRRDNNDSIEGESQAMAGIKQNRSNDIGGHLHNFYSHIR